EQPRHDELEERPAEDAHELAERREDEMAGLVDREIDAVEQPAGPGARHAHQAVDGQKRGEGESDVAHGAGGRSRASGRSCAAAPGPTPEDARDGPCPPTSRRGHHFFSTWYPNRQYSSAQSYIMSERKYVPVRGATNSRMGTSSSEASSASVAPSSGSINHMSMSVQSSSHTPPMK